jgi:membrane-bound serine protease (ClpP class)
MMNSTVAFMGLGLGALVLAAASVAVLSRHKKAATGQLKLMDTVAVVETTLEPEGSVLVRGELWRARAHSGMRIERGARVRVVGAGGHLLEVEPLPRPLSLNE